MRKRPPIEESFRWRYQLPLPPKVDRFGQNEDRLDSAWRQLVFVHTSFRATEQHEYRDLVDALRGIERLFFDHPELAAYYDEWGSMRSTQTIAAPPGDAPVDPHVRHVAAMQAQFMEDVYFVLQLARFANALDNRGWMNLFRAWGRSSTFNRVFARLRPTFSQEFVDFYDNYLRDYPGTIEDYPVPHPWDSATLRADPRYKPAAVEPGAPPAAAAEPERATLPGVFLDSGVQEVGRRSGRLRAPSPSPGGGTRGVTEDPTLAAAVEQQQAPDDARGSPKSMPPNA